MTTPVDILCRELNRLDNDSDRLQMLVTLKSRLNHLQLNADTFYVLFSIFNDENYRLQAIHQLLPFVKFFCLFVSLIIIFKFRFIH